MKKKAYLLSMIALLATFGVMGGSIELIETAEANSNGHSRHSLAGRTFLIRGTWVEWNGAPDDRPDDFSNCYTFEEGGTWFDPKFPDSNNPQNNPAGGIPGTWIQHTGGFVASYTAFAKCGADFCDPGGLGFPDVLLIQNGVVTPTFRRGKLRLRADSTVLLDFARGESLPAGRFVLGVVRSVGYSVKECPAP